MANKFGSQDWANSLLKKGIKVLQEVEREPVSRGLEVLCVIGLLESYGFWWQGRTLRSWLHKYWNQVGRNKKVTLEIHAKNLQTTWRNVQDIREPAS